MEWGEGREGEGGGGSRIMTFEAELSMIVMSRSLLPYMKV